MAAGHDVTLFATADSVTTATLPATARAGGPRTMAIDAKVAECAHIASVFERADEFDVIHNGFDFLPTDLQPARRDAGGHHDPRLLLRAHRSRLRALRRHHRYVSISDADRHPNLRYAATIHHGIDLDEFAVHPEPRRAPAVLRADPSRQGHRRTRSRLRVGAAAGSSSPESSRTRATSAARWRRTSTVERVRYLGPVGRAGAPEVLGGAHALLHLIDFDEPFGYSVVEAMACGTPVIANARGSMGELIEHGVTGYLVHDRRICRGRSRFREWSGPPRDRLARSVSILGRRHGRPVRRGVPRRPRRAVGAYSVRATSSIGHRDGRDADRRVADPVGITSVSPCRSAPQE